MILMHHLLSWPSLIDVMLLFLLHFTSRLHSLDSGLNLVCGRDDVFVDPRTNVTWFPDQPYIDHGLGRTVFVNKHGEDDLYAFLRYFDETKSCYQLPTSRGEVFLIRGSFYYGDYDSELSPPTFSIAIDATLVHRVSSSSTSVKHAEVVFTARDDWVDYCLISLIRGAKPIVSTLEVRLLPGFSTPDGMLETIYHLDNGNLGTSGLDSGFFHVHTGSQYFTWHEDTLLQTENNDVNYEGPAYVPKSVMITAAEAPGRFLSYAINATNPLLDFYVCLHFLELQAATTAPGDRVFDVIANRLVVKESFDILTSSRDNTGTKLCFSVPASAELNVSLVATGTSKKGPMLNALDAYHIIKEVPGTLSRDVEALSTLKRTYPGLKWSGDPCLPASTNWDGIVCDSNENDQATVMNIDLSCKGLNGTVPPSLSKLESLEILRLDENMFTGNIPDFRSLSRLRTLKLDNNILSGTIPEYLGDLPKLKYLYLENNDLEGYIPLKLHRIANFTYSGNQRLLGFAEELRKSRTMMRFFIGGFAGGFVVLLFLMAGCLAYVSRRRKVLFIDIAAFTRDNHQLKATPEYVTRFARDAKGSNHIRRLSLKEVAAATDCFKTIIGEGGFGSVYYGILTNGQAVAVKTRSVNSIQGTREFNTELNLLSRIRHENLVPLLGFCAEEEQEILIYPYMPNGSLQDRLYGEGFKRNPLDWPTRLSIVLGAAKGLAFLHSGGDFSIIHRDVKSSNILLDQSMMAKVADFGFSKYAPQDGDSVVSLEVRGTAGYLDPEYYLTQELTVKSDVYSFGVVLLEVICGREPLSIDRPRAEWSLVEWARPYVQETNIEAIVDPSISTSYSPEAMWRVLEVAIHSVQPHANRRPSMADIVRELEDALIMENNASQYMASVESNPSSILSNKQYDISPAFSENMGSPDPR